MLVREIYHSISQNKRNQWNLQNILEYISGIFDDFFKAGLVPLTSTASHYIVPVSLRAKGNFAIDDMLITEESQKQHLYLNLYYPTEV